MRFLASALKAIWQDLTKQKREMLMCAYRVLLKEVLAVLQSRKESVKQNSSSDIGNRISPIGSRRGSDRNGDEWGLLWVMA